MASRIDFNRLCMKCMKEKKADGVCPYCGFDENRWETPAFALPPHTILNRRYMLGIMLGNGGFGITYIAWDLVLARRVAIKEYFVSGSMYRDYRQSRIVTTSVTTESQEKIIRANVERFEKEAKMFAGLNGLNGIHQVLDSFQENNTRYIVMENLVGDTLLHYVRSHGGRISWAEAVQKLTPVMDSLSILHESKILHRDISPDNMMVITEGKDAGKVKLFGFGGAQILEEGPKERKNTVMLRKNGYSPIEQSSGMEPQGPWTNVYAMAATLYFCICGKPPCDIFCRVEDPNRLEQPHSIGVSVTPVQEKVLLKGLELRGQDRFQTMESFKKALIETLSDSGNPGQAKEIKPEGKKGLMYEICFRCRRFYKHLRGI